MSSSVRGTTPLTILRVNPLEYERELKEFMVANGHAEFPDFFDRGYPAAVRDGGATWLGLGGDGDICLSITRFTHSFTFAGRPLVIGMLGNLMASADMRTFFPAVAMVRRMLADTRAEGVIDLICTDGLPKAAAVFKGAGLRPVGHMDRFVFPVRDRRWHRDAAVRGYQALCRIRALRGPVISRHPGSAFEVAPVATAADGSRHVRPNHSRELYRRRLSGYPGPADHWFTCGVGGAAGSPAAAALVRWPDEQGHAVLHAVYRTPGSTLRPLVTGLVRELRALGAHALQVCAMRNGTFATELVRAGFIPRSDLMPILAFACTTAGDEAVRAAAHWEITAFDMER